MAKNGKKGVLIPGITRNQLAIFDSLAPQATGDGGQPDNPESGVPRFKLTLKTLYIIFDNKPRIPNPRITRASSVYVDLT